MQHLDISLTESHTQLADARETKDELEINVTSSASNTELSTEFEDDDTGIDTDFDAHTLSPAYYEDDSLGKISRHIAYVSRSNFGSIKMCELYEYLSWDCPLNDENQLAYIGRTIVSYLAQSIILSSLTFKKTRNSKDHHEYRTGCVSNNGIFYVHHVVPRSYDMPWYESGNGNNFVIDYGLSRFPTYTEKIYSQNVKLCKFELKHDINGLNVLTSTKLKRKSAGNYNNGDHLSKLILYAKYQLEKEKNQRLQKKQMKKQLKLARSQSQKGINKTGKNGKIKAKKEKSKTQVTRKRTGKPQTKSKHNLNDNTKDMISIISISDDKNHWNNQEEKTEEKLNEKTDEKTDDEKQERKTNSDMNDPNTKLIEWHKIVTRQTSKIECMENGNCKFEKLENGKDILTLEWTKFYDIEDETFIFFNYRNRPPKPAPRNYYWSPKPVKTTYYGYQGKENEKKKTNTNDVLYCFNNGCTIELHSSKLRIIDIWRQNNRIYMLRGKLRKQRQTTSTKTKTKKKKKKHNSSNNNNDYGDDDESTSRFIPETKEFDLNDDNRYNESGEYRTNEDIESMFCSLYQIKLNESKIKHTWDAMGTMGNGDDSDVSGGGGIGMRSDYSGMSSPRLGKQEKNMQQIKKIADIKKSVSIKKLFQFPTQMITKNCSYYDESSKTLFVVFNNLLTKKVEFKLIKYKLDDEDVKHDYKMESSVNFKYSSSTNMSSKSNKANTKKAKTHKQDKNASSNKSKNKNKSKNTNVTKSKKVKKKDKTKSIHKQRVKKNENEKARKKYNANMKTNSNGRKSNMKRKGRIVVASLKYPKDIEILFKNCKCHYLFYHQSSQSIVLMLKNELLEKTQNSNTNENNLFCKLFPNMKDSDKYTKSWNNNNNKNNNNIGGSNNSQGRILAKLRIDFDNLTIISMKCGLINIPENKCRIVGYDDTRSAVIIDTKQNTPVNFNKICCEYENVRKDATMCEDDKKNSSLFGQTIAKEEPSEYENTKIVQTYGKSGFRRRRHFTYKKKKCIRPQGFDMLVTIVIMVRVTMIEMNVIIE